MARPRAVWGIIVPVRRSARSAKVYDAQPHLSRRDFLRVGGLTLMGTILGSTVVREPAAVGTTAPAKFEPMDGLAYTGVSLTRPEDLNVEKAVESWNRWTRLMGGKPAAISHEFTWFSHRGMYAYDFAGARGATPMISIEFTKAPTKEVANAGTAEDGRRTDLLILDHAYAAREYREKVFVRLGHEMNGAWYAYCAFDQGGSPRANTTEDYKQAWRRVVIIFRGGHVRDIDASLADYDLPPLDRGIDPLSLRGYQPLDHPGAYIPPVENAAFVWCPNGQSLPDVAGNAAIEYYPGDDFVDWVGQDVYYAPWWTSMDILFGHMDDFYREFTEWRGKPYMLAEWGLRPPSMGPKGAKSVKSNDSPGFITGVLDWADAHPRAKALVYWSWNFPSEGDYRLQAFPESAKALARGWKDPRFLGEEHTRNQAAGLSPEQRT
jgi:hypothetical protein